MTGKSNNKKTSNGFFDLYDELSFMGDDVGELKRPSKFDVRRPNIIYELEIKTDRKDVYSNARGAVYIGIYFQKPPKLSQKKIQMYSIFCFETLI